MSKKSTKPKKMNEAQLLELLKRVLPKAAPDPALAGKIYAAVEAELKAESQTAAFEKFCERVELPNLENQTLAEVQSQLVAAFGDATINPNPGTESLMVEVTLPDGTQLQTQIKVRPVPADGSDEPEIALKFVPFPVSLPGDPELVWLLGKLENLSAEEAGIGLTKAEEEFWASKTGQKLIRDRVDRNFPEFIARAPAGLLREGGIKRHYKTPEPVKVLRSLAPLKKPKA
jgi:hypothetical protein